MYGISSFKFFYQCCFVRTLNSCCRGLLGLLYILGCCGGTVLDEIGLDEEPYDIETTHCDAGWSGVEPPLFCTAALATCLTRNCARPR